MNEIVNYQTGSSYSFELERFFQKGPSKRITVGRDISLHQEALIKVYMIIALFLDKEGVSVFKMVPSLDGGELIAADDKFFVGVWIRRGNSHYHVSVKSNGTVEEVNGLCNKIYDQIKNYEKKEVLDSVKVKFSRKSQGGYDSYSEVLQCPTWKEISENYSGSSVREVDRILSLESPTKHGKLLLMHGPPGTGKTYVVRALARELKKKFETVVVTDPEQFVSDPKYYLEMGSEVEYEYEGDMAIQKRAKKLFVLEDCADFVMSESRTMHYDKFGKLLNMTDGIFGQGRQDLFLLTFNEEIEQIDPAILRPGRCLANIKIPKLSMDEANKWLTNHGAGADKLINKDVTLAELYSLITNSGRSDEEPKQIKFGFGK